MFSPSETGTTSGATPETRKGTGKPVSHAGAWPWRWAVEAGRAGQPVNLARRAEQGPLHLIHGGGLLLLCPSAILRPSNDTPASKQDTLRIRGFSKRSSPRSRHGALLGDPLAGSFRTHAASLLKLIVNRATA